ncbi:MAG: VCBS repeat-containing protein [Chitinophagaceae bacterium]
MPVFISLIFLLSLNRPVAPVFQAQTIDSSLSIGYGLALSDVDGDGKIDILLADKKQFVWYRNGDWKKFVMIENLTQFDNVCIAARDITGDGKCEVAVGAQWNPSETSDDTKSGSVHFLVRPADPTQRWKAIELHHEPTIHRMRWVQSAAGKFFLVVLPLHGRGNSAGAGEGVKVLAYEYPKNVDGPWPMQTLLNSMHLTHNLDPFESPNNAKKGLYVAGKEGIRFIPAEYKRPDSEKVEMMAGLSKPAGEVRVGRLSSTKNFVATVEPMHGTEVVVYLPGRQAQRIVVDDDVKEGHALAAADFYGTGKDQLVAGWRVPNKSGKVGIKLYARTDASEDRWESFWVDDNGMACEDLQVADLNGDGKPDIVASGRATRNLKIYWNKNGKDPS